jgi:zinc/manganese transport system substrate-binding protein
MVTLLSRRALLAAPLLPAAGLAQGQALPVVASFSILADLVRQVGGDAVAVSSLVPSDGDPHAFHPRPGDLNALRAAAVVVENGLGLEGWLARLVQASGFGGVRVLASAGVEPRRMQEGGRAVPDPHIWQDPRLVVGMVRQIAEGLAGADAARAGAYRLRAESYAAKIRLLDAQIEGRLASVPPGRRRVITTHDAFGYYGARYGVTFLAAQGISTEAEPAPRALARLAAQMRQEGIRTVFLENMTDPRIARAIAREAGGSVGAKVYSDSLSPPGGPAPTWLDMLRYNTDQFAGAMS